MSPGVRSLLSAERSLRSASLLARASAAVLDAVLVLAVSQIPILLARAALIYVQPEAAFILCGIVLVSIALARYGRTPGHAMCGLRVLTRRDKTPGFWRALIREPVKAVSVLPLGIGLWWALFDQRRRTWHDRLTGTRVVSDASRRRRSVTGSLALLMVGIVAAWYACAPLDSYRATRRMAVPNTQRLPPETRPAELLSEVADLPESKVAPLAEWIGNHGMEPLAYATAAVRTHELVIVGEMHEQGDTLTWFNAAIPILHRDGGVTCIAMEVLLAEDNAGIERLVTSPVFDREAAARIARRQPWAMWGWKEYWDVLETVWRVNQAHGSGTRKLRLIGLDRAMDAPSMLMMGIGDVPVKQEVPALEKLRLWRLPNVVALMVLRDGAMAQEVEKEIFDRHERGIVWVGSMHAAAGCRLPNRERWGQFGLMLRHRFGQRVFSIRLHQMDIPASAVDPANAATPAMASFIERVMAKRSRSPIGFDLAGSPLALLRDRGSLEYSASPTVGLGDAADGYIYLKDWRDLRHCSWQPGYITDEMFAAYRPMYQALARRAGLTAGSAAEINAVFSNMK